MDAYIWECAAGHAAAVSEEAMRQAYVRPCCPILVGPAQVCGARLVRRLRPMDPMHEAS